MSGRSGVIRWLMIVIVNLAVLESAAFLAVVGLGFAKPNSRWDLFLDRQLTGVSDATIAGYQANAYDTDLGWDNVPGTQSVNRNILNAPWTATYDASGARTSCMAGTNDSSSPYIATYGDSFTQGDEVNDDATWQCALERKIHRGVANYGVGAYGVDQALLKAERHWKQGQTAPITLLCVYENDLSRALNRYRPFLAPDTGGKLGFKPSFRKIDNDVVRLPNPLRPGPVKTEEIKALAISLIPTDYWASGAARVLPRFPYSVQLLATGFRAGIRERAIHGDSDKIWDIPEGREVMLHMLAEFVDQARHQGTRPVLLMIPKTSDWSEGRVTPAYERFLREVLPNAGLDLPVIDIGKVSFNEREFNLMPFKGHPSVYGNAVIADAVIEGLNAIDGGSYKPAISPTVGSPR